MQYQAVDSLEDLASGRKALMVTHGLDLWSQFTNMDRLWSIDGVSGEEDNFFTLDLDFLNEELSKLDMAQRLLLDEEYACLGEIEKSESVHKIPETETVDKDKPNLTSPSRMGSSKYEASFCQQDIDGLDRSASTGNEEPGGSNAFATRLLEMTGATAKETGDDPMSFPNKVPETPDGNVCLVSKEPSAQLAKTASLFDAKSAEAELDALLDMLDTKPAGHVPVLMPMESFGLARDPGLAFQRACPEALQESSSLDSCMNSSDAKPFNLFVGSRNDCSFHMMESTNSEVKASTVLVKVSDADTRKSVPTLDEDFDNWLDSL
ncbi:hypothetical protein L7F22_051712 [Adiantum nelumboides]|nr:hypothetical protein [Adiantum nelumboides]